VSAYGLYVWVSILTTRSSKIGTPPIFKISVILNISYDKTQWLQKFNFCRSEFFPRFFIISLMDTFDCHLCIKNCVSFWFHLFVQYEHLTWRRLRTCSLTVICCNVRENQAIDRLDLQSSGNTPCNNRKINDLCKRFRYLISWLCSTEVYVSHLSLLYAPAVTFNYIRRK